VRGWAIPAGAGRVGCPALSWRGRSAAPWQWAAVWFAVTAWAGYGGRGAWPAGSAPTTVTSHASPALSCCATLPSIYDGNVAIPLPRAGWCDVAVVTRRRRLSLVARRRGRSAAPSPSAQVRFAVTAWAGCGGRVWPVVPLTTATSHETPARTCCATLPSIYDANVAIPLPSAGSCDVAVVPPAPSAPAGGAPAWSVGGAVAVGSGAVRRNGRGWVRGKGVAGRLDANAGNDGNLAPRPLDPDVSPSSEDNVGITVRGAGSPDVTGHPPLPPPYKPSRARQGAHKPTPPAPADSPARAPAADSCRHEKPAT
jgi:hypothetical protein